MTLGPTRLSLEHRSILRRHRRLIRKFLRQELEWGHADLKSLKGNLRLSLRSQQKGRCYFCRQPVHLERRNAYEDIEHYLDKSRLNYRRWAFSPVNLTISCRACNFVKSTRDLGDDNVANSSHLTPAAGTFRWLHPYFDDFHANIEIGRGWVYSVKADAPKPAESQRLISELKLDELEELLRRKQQFSDRKVRFLRFAAKCVRSNRRALAAKIIDLVAAAEEDAWVGQV